jgi:hypothetical protein
VAYPEFRVGVEGKSRRDHFTTMPSNPIPSETASSASQVGSSSASPGPSSTTTRRGSCGASGGRCSAGAHCFRSDV